VSDPDKFQSQFATLREMLEAAYAEGHAEAMDLCAKTDEQRLRLISEQRSDIEECVRLLDIFVLAHSGAVPGFQVSAAIRLIQKYKPAPRPVQVLSPEEIDGVIKRMNEMRAKYYSERKPKNEGETT